MLRWLREKVFGAVERRPAPRPAGVAPDCEAMLRRMRESLTGAQPADDAPPVLLPFPVPSLTVCEPPVAGAGPVALSEWARRFIEAVRSPEVPAPRIDPAEVFGLYEGA